MPILSSFGSLSISGFSYPYTSGGLFPFTTATFKSPIQATMWSTSNTPTGCCLGPTQAQLSTMYQSFDVSLYNLLTTNTYFKVPRDGYQWFTVPETGQYEITAQGGMGGPTSVAGAPGCKLTATFTLAQGDILWIAVGHSGGQGNTTTSDKNGAGGGGCTIVAYAPSTGGTTLSNITKCLICAAGGRGNKEPRLSPTTVAASSSANGANGTAFNNSFKAGSNNGFAGGYGGQFSYGGFGGGGASDDSFGGSGGYDAYNVTAEPGSNSFIDASGTNQTRINSGDSVYPNSGYVTIRKL